LDKLDGWFTLAGTREGCESNFHGANVDLLFALQEAHRGALEEKTHRPEERDGNLTADKLKSKTPTCGKLQFQNGTNDWK
jgi:hypothetical protein